MGAFLTLNGAHCCMLFVVCVCLGTIAYTTGKHVLELTDWFFFCGKAGLNNSSLKYSQEKSGTMVAFTPYRTSAYNLTVEGTMAAYVITPYNLPKDPGTRGTLASYRSYSSVIGMCTQFVNGCIILVMCPKSEVNISNPRNFWSQRKQFLYSVFNLRKVQTQIILLFVLSHFRTSSKWTLGSNGDLLEALCKIAGEATRL